VAIIKILLSFLFLIHTVSYFHSYIPKEKEKEKEKENNNGYLHRIERLESKRIDT